MYISADLFQRSSVLAYSCNSPITSNTADSNQPLRQYIAIPQATGRNLPRLQNAPSIIAASWRGTRNLQSGATGCNRSPQGFTGCSNLGAQMATNPSEIKKGIQFPVKTTSICIRMHPYAEGPGAARRGAPGRPQRGPPPPPWGPRPSAEGPGGGPVAPPWATAAAALGPGWGEGMGGMNWEGDTPTY